MKVVILTLFNVTRLLCTVRPIIIIVLTLLDISALPTAEAQTRALDLPAPWSEVLPADSRFKLVMGDEAVLDRETGVVWERSPSTTPFIRLNTSGIVQTTAADHCNNLTVGNRLGWRLPTVQELASLLDRSVPFPGPMLPNGHPFSNVTFLPGQGSIYWSATNSIHSGGVWVVSFSGFSNGANISAFAGGDFLAWCVRSAQAVDAQ